MKPILFSTPMVQAILEGRKTQTRRVVKSHEWGCPYGRPGDVLWVRETWTKDSLGRYYYKATTNTIGEEMRIDYIRSGCAWAKWRPSIHMPKAACRLFLQIESVRVERLQEISEADAIAEGVTDFGKQEFHPIWTAKKAFKSLWQFINGTESWDANPLVWVVTFKKIEKP